MRHPLAIHGLCAVLVVAATRPVSAGERDSGRLVHSVSETFKPGRPRLSVKTGALVGAGLGAMVMAVHLHHCEDCGGLGDLGKTAAVTVIPGAVLGGFVGAALTEERPRPPIGPRSPTLRLSWRLRF
jgi:hypothetical protein